MGDGGTSLEGQPLSRNTSSSLALGSPLAKHICVPQGFQ